jgi:hypothetical protein
VHLRSHAVMLTHDRSLADGTCGALPERRR